MALAPLSIKLRCASWGQLATIYKRDLTRGALFLRSSRPPPVGTTVKIDMTLPSETTINLSGVVVEQVGEGGMDGRGPGVDIKLAAIPQSAMWLIETALASHRAPTAPPAAQAAAPRTRPATAGPRADDAGMDDGADLAAAERELYKALSAELASLQKLNPFQLLGVGYGADDQDVRTAFGELTRRYHPDRYAKYPSLELRQLANEIFLLIRDAYRKLDTEAARAQTLEKLGRGPRVIGVPPVHPRTVQRQTLSRGVAVPTPRAPSSPPAPPPRATPPGGVTIERPAKATPAGGVPLANTARASDESARVRAVTAATIASQRTKPPSPSPPSPPAGELDETALDKLLDEQRHADALMLCRRALARNPNDRVARVGIELAAGLDALAGSDRLEAAQRFEAVLEIDPSNERAARELAEMRRLATSERKGLLSRLLGKKD